ncbi:MAG: redox-sensitive transcriptional activator SoxR [Porticoccaceae bacterium]|nr:redox-sensitive transcriptional activator SoxR [Porticoccaceae bacterium]
MPDSNWTVGKVAKRCGVKVSALHFYEAKGLIQSYRNPGNQRRYKADVVRRVSLIKAAQKVGFTLEEIKQTFASLPDNRTPTASDWKKLSKEWREELNNRIAYLERLRDLITGCIGCGCLSMDSCPIYNEGDKLGCKREGAVLLENS